MKFIAVGAIFVALTTSLSAHCEPMKMTSYEWAGLQETQERVFVAGLTEGFGFRLYSVVDKSNIAQVSEWNSLATCLQNKTENNLKALNSALVFEGGTNKSFAEIFWSRAVPVVCKESKRTSDTAGAKLPVQIISHFQWHEFSSDLKRLYLRGVLEAVFHVATLAQAPSDHLKA
jgi:hypothetical protein